MTLSEEARREVLAVMDRYVQSYNSRDLSGVTSLFSKDISGFGSGAREVIGNREEFVNGIRVDFARPEQFRLAVRTLAVGGTMPVAWITAFCDFSCIIDGKKTRVEGRVTAVLRNTGSRWLFEQVHFSLPFPDDLIGRM